MSTYIDVLNANILTKFDKFSEIFSIYEPYLCDTNEYDTFAKIFDDFAKSKKQFLIESIIVFSKKQPIERVYADISNIIQSCDISGLFDKIEAWAESVLPLLSEKQKLFVTRLLEEQSKLSIEIKIDLNQQNICPFCAADATADEKNSEYICENCGYIISYNDELTIENDIAINSTKREKINKYASTIHCSTWLRRIQGKEKVDISDELINEIKVRITGDGVRICDITCEIIRNYLQKMKLTKYNNDIPYIWKLVTNKELALLTDAEENTIVNIFSSVVQTINNMTQSKEHCKYIPYYIYKIISIVMANPRDRNRKRDLLSCIHMQSQNTLATNDKLWDMVCRENSFLRNYKAPK